MRAAQLFAAFASIAAVFAAPTEPEQGGTTDLNPDDFTNGGPKGTWFVKLFSPYCPHCSILAPKWEAAFEQVQSGEALKWGNINCVDYGDFCSSENIRAYPTLRIYRDGKQVYQLDSKGYEKDDLVQFAQKYLELGDGAWAEPTSVLQANQVTTTALNTQRTTAEPAFMTAVYKAQKEEQPEDEEIPGIIFGEGGAANHPNFRKSGDSPATPPAEGGGEYGDGKVFTLTGDYFNDLVLDSSEPWFVKFYSPKCPHCTSMAPAFEEAAQQLNGVINVGEVNCEKDLDLCREQDVTHFPYLKVYFGRSQLPEYLGARSVKNLVNYGYSASKAQIKPCDSVDEVKQAVALSGGSAFIYLYDYTAMPEDWPPLLEATEILAREANGTVMLRSADDTVRDEAGMHHRGPVLAFVYILGAELKYVPYPGSAIPSDIRNVAKIREWAMNVRFIVPRELDPAAMIQYAPYVCMALLGGRSDPGVKNYISHLADNFLGIWRGRQEIEQERMRTERFKLHDTAMAAGDFKSAKQIMKTPIETPWRPDAAFSYTENFEDLDPGEIVCADFHNSHWVKVNKENGYRPEPHEIEDAINALSRGEGLPLSKKVSIPSYSPPQTIFVPPMSDSERAAARRHTLLRIFAVIVCIYGFYRLFIRRKFRSINSPTKSD